MLKSKNGVTIIALVVTIVILIILAVISINIAIGDKGLVSETAKAEDKHKISEIAEKLEIQKANVAFDGKTVNLENYLAQLKKDNVIKDENIEDIDVEYARNIEVEGYVYLVTDLQNGDVLIEYEGVAGKLAPRIRSITTGKVTTNSIEVSVDATRMDGGTYKYYIKNVTNENARARTVSTEYELKEESKNSSYTFTELLPMNTYRIKIEAITENGVVSQETGNIITIEMQDLVQENLEFTYNPEGWTNDKVILTVESKVEINEGLVLQTSKDAIEWNTRNNQTYEENGEMYVRLYDGVNESSYALAEVSKIDKKKPEVTSLKSTTRSIEINATDEASGIIGYALTGNDTEPTDFEKCTNTKSLRITKDELEAGKEYYVWVKDEAGNISESKKIETIEMQTLVTENIEFTYNPEGWSNTEITITANLKVELNEGLQLQTSKNGTEWDTKDNQTYDENGEMYVRLSDGKNESGYAIGEVSKIDKKAPEITSITPSSNSITIAATEEASGIIGYAVTEDNQEPTDFEICENTKTLNVTKKSLLKTKDYYVWIKDEAGNISEGTKTTTLETVALTTANTTFTYSEDDWTNDPVTVTAKVNVSIPDGYYVETSKDGGASWQKQASQTLSANGEMYVRLSDGNNTGNHATAKVEKIDTTAPRVTSVTPSTTSIAIKATDGASGIIGYKVTNTNAQPTSFDTCASTTSLSITKTGLTKGTNYWVWVKDAAGNVSTGTKTTTTSPIAYTYSSVGSTTVTLPAGKYKLEVWGAQGGGNSSYPGGKGGYSVGTITLSTSTTVYVVVGQNNNGKAAATNGGGAGGSGGTGIEHGFAGGGATHIAKASGFLNSLSSNQSSVLIVAGGGGGSDTAGLGGVGGGTNGTKNGTGYGGTQTSGYKFGEGAPGANYSAGGGGGWYGGGPGASGDPNNGGGGGSGYVNATYLTSASTIAGNSSMPSTSGGTETGHSGNGYAKITSVN